MLPITARYHTTHSQRFHKPQIKGLAEQALVRKRQSLDAARAKLQQTSAHKKTLRCAALLPGPALCCCCCCPCCSPPKSNAHARCAHRHTDTPIPHPPPRDELDAKTSEVGRVTVSQGRLEEELRLGLAQVRNGEGSNLLRKVAQLLGGYSGRQLRLNSTHAHTYIHTFSHTQATLLSDELRGGADLSAAAFDAAVTEMDAVRMGGQHQLDVARSVVMEVHHTAPPSPCCQQHPSTHKTHTHHHTLTHTEARPENRNRPEAHGARRIDEDVRGGGAADQVLPLVRARISQRGRV